MNNKNNCKKDKKYIDWNHRLDDATCHLRKKCKCGHTKVVPYSSKYEYVICDWCGRRLYRDDKKQIEYDKKSAKNDFIYKVNKCLKKAKDKMEKKKYIDKNKLKKKTFKCNLDYFEFCKDHQVYYVETASKEGQILAYYGPKLGRPPKNNKNRFKQFKRKIKYFN